MGEKILPWISRDCPNLTPTLRPRHPVGEERVHATVGAAARSVSGERVCVGPYLIPGTSVRGVSVVCAGGALTARARPPPSALYSGTPRERGGERGK